jgi:hypothetical protein
LIKALKHQARTVEIVSGLRPAPVERTPHLRTWRDGMRHLLFILSERPRLFEVSGLLLIVLSSLLQAMAGLRGEVQLAGASLLGLHSQVLLFLGGLVGAQIYGLSAAMFLQRSESPRRLTRSLIEMDEGSLFGLLLLLLAGMTAVIGWLVWHWIQKDFSGLQQESTLLLSLHFLVLPALITMNLLGVHVLRKGQQS